MSALPGSRDGAGRHLASSRRYSRSNQLCPPRVVSLPTSTSRSAGSPWRPLGSQRRDTSMHEVLRHEPVAERAVEAHGQLVGADHSGEFDERADGTRRRDSVDLAMVDRIHPIGAVKADGGSAEVSMPRHEQMEGPSKYVSIEAEERGRRRAGGPHRFADVEKQAAELDQRCDRTHRAAEAVRT